MLNLESSEVRVPPTKSFTFDTPGIGPRGGNTEKAPASPSTKGSQEEECIKDEEKVKANFIKIRRKRY